jgi:hypothetical protein
VKIDTSIAGKASIKFSKGSAAASISTAQVFIDIGKINFKVLNAPTLFLLCLADIDRLKVYFNNLITLQISLSTVMYTSL